MSLKSMTFDRQIGQREVIWGGYTRLCLFTGVTSLVVLAFALGAVFGQEARAPASSAMNGDIPRMVLTFYYPWYGNPEKPGGSGRWSHWRDVDVAAKKIGSSTNYPLLGAYDSHDPNTIRQHCRWTVEAGIHGWIVSWWGHGDFSDQALEKILATVGPLIRITVYYETVPNPKTPASATKDIVRLLRKYGDHPRWLRVNGKPVVFVYGRAIGEIGVKGWQEVVAAVRQEYPQGVFFQGDRFSAEAAQVFDGLHTYNTAGQLRGKSLEEVRAWCRETYPRWVKLAREAGKSVALTVIPGYDDTKIRKPGLAVDRFDGQSYGIQWEEAIAAQPDWVLITSFNEWHEGSEIEPSLEHGQKYLELTRQWATQFAPLRPVQPMP
ncbi:MAG: glycoside hydrolase family 99-like domain-containing protein [Thermoguttaceae bacterium]|nr:glycoside hydrolase family 99-like domain-containing protein [Thermoguttaceae bacterium]MDW8079383.1 glycoside hydrolase family 99-like domain-containing protein [Thermoguttaceae bacterium]